MSLGHASQEVLLRAPLVALRALSVLPYCTCVLHRHKKALADVHLPYPEMHVCYWT